MTHFEKDLLESIRQANRGEGRVTKIRVTAATEKRIRQLPEKGGGKQVSSKKSPLRIP
jgi:hypothetical protein